MRVGNRPPCPRNKDSVLMKSLYGGRLSGLLPLISSPIISYIGGWFMNTRASASLISGFIRRNKINMTPYPERAYKTFNDFFTRRILPEYRPGVQNSRPEWLISPCDSRLSVYEIDESLTFTIKGGQYSLSSFLRNPQLAASFAGGYCLVFRLAVDDYHRYCFFDGGTKGENIKIKGRYYTVQPIALKAADYFKENTREYTVMNTDYFGRAIQAEIGATFVGRIKNHQRGRAHFSRGDEKGMFLFGGSTVVVILGKDKAKIDSDILENSQHGFETRVQIGDKIGESLQ